MRKILADIVKMAVFRQNVEEYPTNLIQQLVKTSHHFETDASVTLYGGAQQIKVPALLPRNASKK